MIKFKKLKISIFTPLAIAAILLANFSASTLLLFAAAAIHEIGHLIALRLVKARVLEIAVYPFGAEISADTTKISYAKETAVSLSGPLANLALSLILFILLLLDIKIVYKSEIIFFFFANFALFFINIMPIKLLDGGRAFESFLCSRKNISLETALKACEITSTFAFFTLSLCALYVLTVTNYNFSLLIFCAYLIISVYASDKKARHSF